MNIAMRVVIIVSVLLLPAFAWAALPLITDDTETLGKGNFQLEIGGEYDRDREAGGPASVDETDYIITSTLTYGISDQVDIFVISPYVQSSAETKAATTRVNGISDTAFGVKWRFYEKEGLSFAIRPGVAVPTGNDKKVLGTGKVGYGAYFIVTKETDPWEMHVNLGYLRNENRIDERQDIWHASLAGAYEIKKSLKACADIGIETNRDRTSEIEPRYMLGGIIYEMREDFELSFGVKAGLNRPETDWALLPGVTSRF